MTVKTAYEVCTIKPAHLARVVALEKECFEFPWRFGDFYSMLTLHRAGGLVAVSNGKVIGYVIYSRMGSEGEAFVKIDNIAVAATHRREGVASALAGEALRRTTRDSDSARIDAMVRERNLAAQLFLRANGFKAIQTLRNQFEETGEDAYLFRRHFGAASPAPQEPALTQF